MSRFISDGTLEKMLQGVRNKETQQQFAKAKKILEQQGTTLQEQLMQIVTRSAERQKKKKNE